MLKISAVRAGALSALGAALLVGGATTTAAAEGHREPSITVTGTGSASATPDIAIVTAGVEVRRSTAIAAAADQADAAQALLDATHAQGIADKDIVTQGLGLQPDYDYSGPTPMVTGYTASESFAITVHDVNQTGEVVQALVTATGDSGRVSGVSFGLADHATLRGQARADAVADAYRKAKQLAALSGHGLGDVMAVAEGGGPSQPSGGFTPPGAAAAAPPIATGQIREEVQVTAVYALGPLTGTSS